MGLPPENGPPENGASEVAAVSIRIAFPNGGSLDAEDVALIETIRARRSILGASRALGISYRKAWLMADALNRTFESRVIETFPGRRGAGAEITVFGERVVALFLSAERNSRAAAAAPLAELLLGLNPEFEKAELEKEAREKRSNPG